MVDSVSAHANDDEPAARGVAERREPLTTRRPSTYEVARTYSFDAAHRLSWHRGACAQLHGHTYNLTTVVEGALDDNGIVIDFGDLDAVVEEVVATLDHKYLNEVIKNPTVENLAAHVWDELVRAGLRVSEVSLWETSRSWARLRW